MWQSILYNPPNITYFTHGIVIPHFMEGEKLNEFKEGLCDTIESIFNEEFDAKLEFRKYSRCD